MLDLRQHNHRKGLWAMSLRETLSGYLRTIQGDRFPWPEQELGPPSERHKQLVTALEVARVEGFLRHWRGVPGRPSSDRSALARTLVAKAVFNIATTNMLIERLLVDKRPRRLCGWPRPNPHQTLRRQQPKNPNLAANHRDRQGAADPAADARSRTEALLAGKNPPPTPPLRRARTARRCRRRRWCRSRACARWRSGGGSAGRRPWGRCPTGPRRRTAARRRRRRPCCG